MDTADIQILPLPKALPAKGGEATVDGSSAFCLPAQMSEGAAGFDLRAALAQPMALAPGERALVPCGFRMEMPHGIEAQVRPRSGLAVKHGITCLNSPGTIDADYRGEVQVLLINHGAQPFFIEPGARIAQLVFARLPHVRLSVATSLRDSARGSAGFGSTGEA